MRSIFTLKCGLRLLALLLPALLMAGCGAKTGNISGKVSYQGKTLPGGMINFMSEGPNTITKSCGIQKDGSYSVTGVPVGLAKITVQGVTGRPRMIAPPQLKKDKGVTEAKPDQSAEVYVPPKYGNSDQSGLTYDVKPGAQDHNVELK